ncbi:MAG TPA: hypothetical protein VJR89_09470 [Polyangiales bacterium]|nr:hypothetical protein [Polyangiales bacterium]
MSYKLEKNPVHLGLGALVLSEPTFTGMEWYEAYAARHVRDGNEGRLVSMYTFDAPWDSWEMHPQGHELVVCTAGQITLIQLIDGDDVPTTLNAGEYAINKPGVWHTADIDDHATALFITAGAGTQHKRR